MSAAGNNSEQQAPEPPVSAGAGFDAFLSYSSSDLRVVKRIQRFLESYKDKRGRALRVFLDQTDIRGGSLRPEIESALEASRFLIVCCSPAAAESRWVDSEVSAYLAARSDGNVALVLLKGEPKDVIPKSASALEPRYHDLRNGWIGRVPKPRARDELLRLLALITGQELRSLIDWQRRRTLAQLGMGVVGVVAATGGVAWYVRSQRRIRAGDLTASVQFQPLGEGADEGFLEIFVTDVELFLFGSEASSAPAESTLRWTRRGSLLGEAPSLSLTSNRQQAASDTRRTVDGPSYTAIRTFEDFSGELGVFADPAVWGGAVFDARLEAMVPRETPVQGRIDYTPESLRRQFDEQYGISPADKEGWGEDYSISPLPIRATLELRLAGKPIGSTEALVAHVREWDEDVRGLHVVAFPRFVVSTS